MTSEPVVPATGAVGRSCPIAPGRVDGTAVRLGAGLSLAVLGVALWGGWPGLLLALSLDFALRAFGLSAPSPTGWTSTLLRRSLGLVEHLTNAGPKRFAASLGALFSFGAGLSLALGLRSLGWGLAAILGLCAVLEAGLGFCLACQIHPLLPGNPARSAA